MRSVKFIHQQIHSLLNFIEFNKECICWCMKFIGTKICSTMIKKIISEVLHVGMYHCVMPHVMYGFLVMLFL